MASRLEQIIAVIVAAGLIGGVFFAFWHENERRYAALSMTGCFGDSASSPLGVSQECNGARRLCRDSPPLLDWRHYCD